MLKRNPLGYFPQIHKSAYIDDTAIICGRVIIEENVFVGPYAVIRADELNSQGDMDPIRIKKNSNIQDGVVIHAVSGSAVTIGESTSIAHRAIVHGPCTIEDRVFIGFNAVIFDCYIHQGSVISHNAVVDGGVTLPENSYVDALLHINFSNIMKLQPIKPEHTSFAANVIAANHYLVAGYKAIEEK